jgi:hypothetical protein
MQIAVEIRNQLTNIFIQLLSLIEEDMGTEIENC